MTRPQLVLLGRLVRPHQISQRLGTFVRNPHRRQISGPIAARQPQVKLTLNMEKTHITHVNDGFVFLGHRIIRKRGPRGSMRPVTTIPWEKYRGFAERLVKQLSGNYSMNRMDLLESLNRQLAGWAAFYQYADFTATVFRKVDRVVFWKLGYWLARKYRRGFSSLMRDNVRSPEAGRAKTWVLTGQSKYPPAEPEALRCEPLKAA